MHETLFPITFFIFLTLSFTVPLNLSSSQPSVANALSTSSGKMTLYRDDLGFYIYAYNTAGSSDNSPRSNGIPMILGIYTSKTSLMTNCLNFSSYNCSSKTCDSIPNSQARQEYPYFTAKGYEASAILYLDYNYWSLNDFALITTSCKSNTSSNFGSSRYGIIGMGIESVPAYMNYAFYASFAVSIAPDLWSGGLTFLNYSTQINREQITQPIFTDSSWNIRYIISVIQIGNFNTTAYFNIFFDLGADTIGLPNSLFEPLMKYFREEVFLDCTHALIRPQCGYNGLINNLPNISIIFPQQNTTIVIPPAIYIQNASNITGIIDLVTLNLRGLGQDLTGDSYSVPEYKNSIIFDINFMSYYYVVFNFTLTGPYITLYLNKEKHNTDPKNDNNHAVFILFGCIGFIVLMAVVYGAFRCYRYQKKKYSRITQTIAHEALITKDIQSLSPAHHVNALQGEKGE